MSSSLTGVLLLALITGCQAGASVQESEPFVPPVAPETESIGYFLANYDKSLRRWTDLKLSPATQRDLRTLRALEASLKRRALDRQDELVTELETGPPSNREVAAVALGFTEDPAVLSPLLASLEDPSPSVVQKTLLGIGLLEDPATPMAQLLFLLGTANDPWTRNNAAYALHCIVAVGGRDPELAEVCREALIDDEPGVRAQAASVLGMLHDAESITYLGDLLQDEVNLVVQAAMTALVRIGREHHEEKGQVARILVDALDRVEEDQRPRLVYELSLLAERNFGDDTEPWREWAYRMP